MTAPDYAPRSPLDETRPEPHRVNKAWSTLRARAARLGLAVYRVHADDDERVLFVVGSAGIRMFPDADALEAALGAAEHEANQVAPQLRPALEWTSRRSAS